jgi:uncharacterized membrane protein
MSKKISNNANLLRLVLSLLIANGIRLVRIIPNNDPVMSMALPFSRRSSALTSFTFPFVTMVSFDFVTGYVGPWTLVTATTYGTIGLAFHYRLKDKKSVGIKMYLGYGIIGVLVFDFVTGVLATPLLYGGTFEESLIGQIPFTAMHLLTSSFFILIVTPLLDREVLLNKRLSDNSARIWMARIFGGLAATSD